MALTVFPTRARRDDPNGHMIVQQNLEFLRDAFDGLAGKLLGGSASITNPLTTVTVTHGLGSALYAVALTPVNGDPGARYWINLKTATQFQIGMSAPPGGTTIFDWIVKGV